MSSGTLTVVAIAGDIFFFLCEHCWKTRGKKLTEINVFLQHPVASWRYG